MENFLKTVCCFLPLNSFTKRFIKNAWHGSKYVFEVVLSFTEIDQALADHLLNAARRGNIPEVLEMLELGVPVDSRNEYGDTPLHLAAYRNQTDVVQVLLQNGAGVNKQTDMGVTPLHAAAWENSTDVIKVLLQQGALTNIKNTLGYTPLDMAYRRDNKEALSLLKRHWVSTFTPISGQFSIFQDIYKGW